MNLKTVDTTYAGIATVNTDTATIYNFNNKEGWVQYNAQLENSNAYVDYRINGRLDSVADKLEAWSNPFKVHFAIKMQALGYNQNEKKQARNEIKKWVENHQSEIFTKSGDFKKRLKKVLKKCGEDLNLN